MTSSGYAAVFFDAGETLVHPHPTFPDLFAEILRREGHDISPETIRESGHVVFDRFRAAAEANELWTTSPERSRRFWHDVYGIFFEHLVCRYYHSGTNKVQLLGQSCGWSWAHLELFQYRDSYYAKLGFHSYLHSNFRYLCSVRYTCNKLWFIHTVRCRQ